MWCYEIERLDNYQTYAGIAGLKMLSDGKVVGGYNKHKEYVDANNLQRRRYNLLGDKAEIYKTDILRQFPFREFLGENFLSECTVWNRIAEAGYKLRWFMRPIYVCEYRPDGLSKNATQHNLDSFEGYTYTVKERIRLCDLFEKVSAIGGYAELSHMKGISLYEAANRLDVNAFIMLTLRIAYVWGKKISGK